MLRSSCCGYRCGRQPSAFACRSTRGCAAARTGSGSRAQVSLPEMSIAFCLQCWPSGLSICLLIHDRSVAAPPEHRCMVQVRLNMSQRDMSSQAFRVFE